jgi:hypothetical protein
MLTSVVYDVEALCEERHDDMFFGPNPKDIGNFSDIMINTYWEEYDYMKSIYDNLQRGIYKP